MRMRTWNSTEARAKLCEVVRRAANGEPQIVTRHGTDAVVFISVAEFNRLGGEKAFSYNVPKVRGESKRKN